MVTDSKRGYKLGLALLLAGSCSGVVAIGTAYFAGQSHLQLFPGIIFGVFIAVCLALFEPRPKFWRAVRFVVVTSIAYFLSLLIAAVVQMRFLPLPPCSTGPCMSESLTAIFLGGMVGGFLILAEGIVLLHPQLGWRAIDLSVLPWSVFGGILGIIGWELGPTLGIALWSGAHALGLTAPTETALNATGETSHGFSLLFVWQGGMGLVLGIVLRRFDANPLKEVKQP
ncbi:MAG: hypothetical protein ACYDD2_15070 [Candidatus Acidiferrales bacterium]